MPVCHEGSWTFRIAHACDVGDTRFVTKLVGGLLAATLTHEPACFVELPVLVGHRLMSAQISPAFAAAYER